MLTSRINTFEVQLRDYPVRNHPEWIQAQEAKMAWCKTNINGELYTYPGTAYGAVVWVFDNESDAVLFKLRWA